MKMRKLAVAAVAAASLGCASAASAAPMTFFGQDTGVFTQSGSATGAGFANSQAAEANFLSNLVGVGTETFEGFADGNGSPLPISFPGAGTATLLGGGQVDNDPGTGQNAISGSKWWRTGAGNDFRIDFDSAVAAFGFYGIDIGDIGAQLTVTFLDGSDHSVAIPHSTGGGMNGSVIYFGYIDTDNPFTSVRFTNPSSGDDFGFDDFTIGSIQQVVPAPEPAAIAFLGLGLAGIGFARRRRKA